MFARAVTVFQFLVVAGTFSTFSKKLFDRFVLPEPFVVNDIRTCR